MDWLHMCCTLKAACGPYSRIDYTCVIVSKPPVALTDRLITHVSYSQSYLWSLLMDRLHMCHSLKAACGPYWWIGYTCVIVSKLPVVLTDGLITHVSYSQSCLWSLLMDWLHMCHSLKATCDPYWRIDYTCLILSKLPVVLTDGLITQVSFYKSHLWSLLTDWSHKCHTLKAACSPYWWIDYTCVIVSKPPVVLTHG